MEFFLPMAMIPSGAVAFMPSWRTLTLVSLLVLAALIWMTVYAQSAEDFEYILAQTAAWMAWISFGCGVTGAGLALSVFKGRPRQLVLTVRLVAFLAPVVILAILSI